MKNTTLGTPIAKVRVAWMILRLMRPSTESTSRPDGTSSDTMRGAISLI